MPFTDKVQNDRTPPKSMEEWPSVADVEGGHCDEEVDFPTEYERYQTRKQLFDQFIERYSSITAAALQAVRIEYILMNCKEPPTPTE